MQFSGVEIRFIVTIYLYSTFANDLKRNYFFSKNVHSYRALTHTTSLYAWYFIFRINVYEKIIQEYHENVVSLNPGLGFFRRDYSLPTS